MSFARLLVAILSSSLVLILLSPLLILSAPFGIVAAATRWLAARREPATVGWQALMEYDGLLGWKPKPNLNRHYLTVARDSVCRLATDSDGWPRSTSWPECEAVVLGDSFAFGYGVDAQDAFFTVGSKKVKTLGAPGYNMVQEALLMETARDYLADKTLVWWVYLGNDLLDNLLPGPIGYRTPFLRSNPDGSWQVETAHVSEERWTLTKHPDYPEALAQLCTPSFLSSRAYGAARELLQKGAALCANAGARLVVMTIPAPAQLSEAGVERLRSFVSNTAGFDPDHPDRELAGICEELGIPFLPGRKYLGPEHFKRVDPHWNKKGHRLVGRLLGEIVDGVLPPKPLEET